MEIVGVDACGKLGWVGIRLVDGRYAGSVVDVRLETLIARTPQARVVAVDMPLGLMGEKWRDADHGAKALLGARRSSVFMVAPEAAWKEATHADASEVCRQLTGSGLSAQAWALRDKLLEARACWTADPARVFEVHPEVSFLALAGRTPLLFPKKTWRGQMLRRSLLADAGIDLPGALGEADTVPVDDVLDAAAAAWSAHRIATGASDSVPVVPQLDSDGRAVEIRY
ncbi:DUF429 domain-containing protein [Kitasatospora sp. NPDC048365]|uniref:DUF429 domain-containing protein n=1 Tax=Kitasatospora sp. NPDC048365 TaxID=3364050 RepID=UPI003715D542